ncbi:hypothetical protein BDV96DRAFT_586770 [Lophiotrema nucula]|uniref:Zn(2)-C6 fungal-type domain-containing protein n=1 Tax=Lophiotrema nucula TaxID=690887 RepID=A0A6A5YNY8_9PLEO|nr:hypothetical protein BDV96DRAFT_586770 [Lophiotrema nucula]
MATRPTRKNSESTKQLQTCDVCKLRHQKCSGDRPSCNHCELRNLECVYSNVPAHNVDRSVVRKRSLKLDGGQQEQRSPESEASTMRNAASSVYTSTPPNALEIHPDARKRLKTDTKASKPKGPRMSATASLTYLVDAVTHIAAPAAQASGITSSQSYYGHTQTQIPELWIFGHAQPSQLVDHRRLPSKAHAQSLLDSFLNGINNLIFVCDPAESRLQLNALLTQEATTGDDVKALAYLQLCLGAASADGTTDDECEALFILGKKHLESALELHDKDWLWVAQATLLKCLYEVERKPAKCYLSLGSAIKIAQTYRIDLAFEDSTIQAPEEYARWRQLWLSMITLDAWLSSILGRTPQITSTTSKDPFLKNLNLTYGLPDCIVQTSIAKMGVVICRMLKDIHGGRRVDIRAYDQFKAVLERWLHGVPRHLQLAPTTSDGAKMSAQDQTAMFQLKVVHLGATLLLFRPLLLQCAAMEQQQPAVKPDTKIREHAQTCVDAAVRIGYCCSAMKERGLLPQRSWPSIYLVFTSALIILVNISRRRILPIPDPQQRARDEQENSSLNMCIDILSFCAERDRVAGHFLQILQPLRTALLGRRSSFPQNIQPPMSPPKNLDRKDLQRPSLAPLATSSSSSARASASTSTPTSTSTRPSSAFSPSSMDGLEFTGHQAFPDTSFLHPSQDATITQEISQGLSFEDMDDWNMDDWLVNPQDGDDGGLGQMPDA